MWKRRRLDAASLVPELARDGVSAFHLWWGGLPDAPPIVEAAVTLTVTRAPNVNRLYFWALQVGFSDGYHSLGAAHTGLQWNPNHPASRAVNWGGYAEPPDRAVFDGSVPDLPGSPGDPNTRAYPWQPRTPYRFTISRSVRGWRSAITDQHSNETTIIRDLYAGGDRLTAPVVWAEIFARCVDPPTEVRWTDLTVKLADRRTTSPAFVTCSFPGVGECPNTDSLAAEGALVQRTNVPRTGHDGQHLVVPVVGERRD